jgi:uroporphyrinogen-III synthase
MRLIVIRPEPGCSATAAAARAQGFEVWAAPLFTVAPLAWQPPAPGSVDAVMLGSANAARHAGGALHPFLDLPCLAVGGATADAARAAGFTQVIAGSGGIQDLAEQLPAGTRAVLRLAGREHMPLALPDGIELVERVVYASDPLALDAETARMLPGNLVLLHSPRAARHFAAEHQRLGLDRAVTAIAALSPAIAAAAGSGWAASAAALRPDDPALLALARRMCNTLAGNDKGAGKQ